MGTYDYSRVEQNTRAFLESLQKNSGPPIYKLSPVQARNVSSTVQAAPIEKLEGRTVLFQVVLMAKYLSG